MLVYQSFESLTSLKHQILFPFTHLNLYLSNDMLEIIISEALTDIYSPEKKMQQFNLQK